MGNQLIEVEHIGEWHFLMFRGTLHTKMVVRQNRRNHTVRPAPIRLIHKIFPTLFASVLHPSTLSLVSLCCGCVYVCLFTRWVGLENGRMGALVCVGGGGEWGGID